MRGSARALASWTGLGLSLALGACEVTTTIGRVPDGGLCDEATCPDGCCDGFQCVPFARQEAQRCGAGGEACGPCPGGFAAVCAEGVCRTSQCGQCAGCCELFVCTAGRSEVSCGRAGEPCQSCGIEESCVAGRCEPCGPTNCAGCCQLGSCVAGETDLRCGRGGVECRSCGVFSSCRAGTCE